MALYEYKSIERDKNRPFAVARPLRGFTIESKVEKNGKTVALGTLEFRDVTEPLGSDNRNVLINWTATTVVGADRSANWNVQRVEAEQTGQDFARGQYCAPGIRHKGFEQFHGL